MTAAIPGTLLRGFTPFERLAPELGELIDPLLEPCRFRLGQTVLLPDVLPAGVLLIQEGQLRSLAPAPRGQGLRTIERIGPGATAGWAGLLRGAPCEQLRASTEVKALLLPAGAGLERRVEVGAHHQLRDASAKRRVARPEQDTFRCSRRRNRPRARRVARLLDNSRGGFVAGGFDTENQHDDSVAGINMTTPRQPCAVRPNA